jgi:hypothetical protein
MKHLNDTNGASRLTLHIAELVTKEFEGSIFGAEFGVAYGGGVEAIGLMWGARGKVYGFDTFEGHPKEVGEICEKSKEAGGVHSFAATCMDSWYQSSEYGTEAIKYNYIRNNLDEQGLLNVILVKGLVSDKTDVSFIPYLNYCFIDLDFPLSNWQAYNLVKDKIVPGGYLMLHDCVPKGHIHGCWEVYQRIMETGGFDLLGEYKDQYLVIMRKK